MQDYKNRVDMDFKGDITNLEPADNYSVGTKGYYENTDDYEFHIFQ